MFSTRNAVKSILSAINKEAQRGYSPTSKMLHNTYTDSSYMYIQSLLILTVNTSTYSQPPFPVLHKRLSHISAHQSAIVQNFISTHLKLLKDFTYKNKTKQKTQ